MSHNPFAPPQSAVSDVAVGQNEGPPFFPVSAGKFLIMSVCTLSLYQLYWFYKNWQFVRRRTGEAIMPFWRAFFGVIFCYALFKRVKTFDPQLPSSRLAAGPLAIGWVLLNLCSRLPDPWWLLSFASVLLVLPVVQAVAEINAVQAPGHDPNARLSGLNWVGVVVGGLLIVLMAIGLVVGEAGP